MDTDTVQNFIERFGVSLFVACWFMFRMEKAIARLTNRVNKLIITNVLVAQTLELGEQKESLIAAATEEDP